jgi:hypothetical protein
MMRVLIWATTLQADILSLVYYLSDCRDVQLMVVADQTAGFRNEPICRFRPINAVLYDRANPDIKSTVRKFAPDVVVADNHIPFFLGQVKFCTMWHGLGWKARGKADIEMFYKQVERLTGQDPRCYCDNFRAQCYGEPDRRWRIEKWGLKADACRAIGMMYTDLLLNLPYDKATLQPYYDIDIVSKKVVLLSISWHYGRMQSQNLTSRRLYFRDSRMTADLNSLIEILETIREAGMNCLLCLHDKKRYESKYLSRLLSVTRPFDNLQIKFKSEHQDNLADLVAADIMISNLSSFITFFYFSGRPSIHLLPSTDHLDALRYAQYMNGKLSFRKLQTGEPIWMNDPNDNGGLTAHSVAEIKYCLNRAIADPRCCLDRSRRWIKRHVHRPDGQTAHRFYNMLLEFVNA